MDARDEENKVGSMAPVRKPSDFALNDGSEES